MEAKHRIEQEETENNHFSHTAVSKLPHAVQKSQDWDVHGDGELEGKGGETKKVISFMYVYIWH